jgi:hypothetical protein
MENITNEIDSLKIISTFEEIEEIYNKLKSEKWVNGDLKETLKRNTKPYRDTWDKIFSDALEDWVNSENSTFSNDIFLTHIKKIFNK